MKRWTIFLLTITIAVYLCACAGTQTPTTQPDYPNDESIRLIDGELGEYSTDVDCGKYTITWHSVPAGTYEITNEGARGTVFVIGNDDSTDERAVVWFKEKGETSTITVNEDTHIELSAGTMVRLNIID